ncbi:MAG: hypothetical protein GXY05_03495 [Clostridiales bacterium]|nr:hypothetical protein [Clostridiales bacterium]
MPERKISKTYTISATPYFKVNKIYNIVAIPNGLRFEEYRGNLKKAHFLGDASIQCMSIPAGAMEIAGFKPDEKVMMQPWNEYIYLFKKQEKIDAKDFDKVKIKMPSMVSTACGDSFFEEAKQKRFIEASVKGRQITMPKEASEILGGGKKYYDVEVALVKNNEQTWIELRTLLAEWTENSFSVTRRYNIPMQNEMSGIIYQQTVKGENFGLPNIFMRQFSVKAPKKLPVWYSNERGAYIIEGPLRTCAVCGEIIRTTDTAPCHIMNACPECSQELGPEGAISAINKTIKASYAVKTLFD